jgi:hypothetical protein
MANLPTIDTPVECTIRAVGTLDPQWSDRLGGLCVHPSARSSPGRPITELTGQLLDQAALVGVLVTLYDLGLPLLSVACRAAGRAGGDTVTIPPAGPRRARARSAWEGV